MCEENVIKLNLEMSIGVSTTPGAAARAMFAVSAEKQTVHEALRPPRSVAALSGRRKKNGERLSARCLQLYC